MGGTSLLDSAKPILGAAGDLLKLVLTIGLPVALVVFVLWIAFLRWSQAGVDL